MNLSDKAMLAKLNISQWTGRKMDKKATKETADKHQADIDMVSAYKSLVPKQALAKITSIVGKARNEFYFHTLPWTDEGSRILTSAGYFNLSKEMRKLRQEMEDAVDEFVPLYPAIKEQAKKLAQSGSLGTLFNEDEYPDEKQIRSKFSFDFGISPLPDAADFRVKLSDTETKLIKQQIERDVNEAQHAAMQHVWNRMEKVVAHMATTLKGYKVLDKPKKVKGSNGKTRHTYVENSFHDTLVTNISDLLDVIPALNLTDDPNVSQFAKDMRKLVAYTADQLKENDTKREQIAAAADDILSKMAQFV